MEELYARAAVSASAGSNTSFSTDTLADPMEVIMQRRKIFSAKDVAYFAILLALVIVLQLFASAIPMFGVTLNFSLIPIVLAGIFFGMWGGGALGLVSGLITFIVTAVMGREPSTAFLFQANPAVLTIVCIGKTTVAGFVAGLLYRLIAKKNRLAAAYVASAVVAILNTGIYLAGMVVMKDDVAAFLGTEATAQVVFVTVFGLVWLNLVLELAVNILFAPAIHRVVLIAEKKFAKRGVKRSPAAASAEGAQTDPKENDHDPLH